MKGKRYTCFDIALIKLAVAAFVFWMVAVCPFLQDWLLNICWSWYLLIIAIVLAIWPTIKFFKKSD